ncbi:MAG: AbrB/MazE/SpoVT family DNA-binding domain-containing protein [Phycisphaerae bacterium]
MKDAVVTTKGQVVIPVEIRRKYKIKRGTRVRFQDRGGEISIAPITEEMIYANIGFLRGAGDLLGELRREKKREREL